MANPIAATGTVIGVLMIVWMTISAKWPAALGGWTSPFHSFMITVIGTMTILLVGLLVSKAMPPAKGSSASVHAKDSK